MQVALFLGSGIGRESRVASKNIVPKATGPVSLRDFFSGMVAVAHACSIATSFANRAMAKVYPALKRIPANKPAAFWDASWSR